MKCINPDTVDALSENITSFKHTEKREMSFLTIRKTAFTTTSYSTTINCLTE
jgi:hypothetical protein